MNLCLIEHDTEKLNNKITYNNMVDGVVQKKKNMVDGYVSDRHRHDKLERSAKRNLLEF